MFKFLDKPCDAIVIATMSAYHHGLQWEDGMIPYNMAKRLIKIIIGAEESDDNKALIYVTGREKRE